MTSYRDYVDKFVPPPNRPLLETVLDQLHSDGTERHLLEIAHYITDWEVKLVVPLGLTREEVEGIKERLSDPELRKRQVLRVWKDKEGLNATYGRLLDKFLQGKNGKGAQKICEIVSEVALPPYGKHSSEKQEQEDEVSAAVIKRNFARIKGSFATLVTDITASLTKKSIDMGDFLLYITTLFPPGDFVAYAKSVTEVFRAITQNQLWDYNSFTPVEEIVKKFGENDPQLTGWINNYKSEVAGFKAVTKIAVYIQACREEEDIADSEQSIRQNLARYDRRYCHKLSIKLKARITEKSLDYIDQFWRSIADYFLLPSLPVLLDTIKEGCVEVTWLVPTVPALQMEANMEDSEDFWRNLEVTRVEIDGVVHHIHSDMRLTVELLDPMEKIFLDACRTGMIEQTEAALDHKVNVDTVNPNDGYTALMMAAATANMDIMLLLLEHNTDVNIVSQNGWTALQFACKEGLLDMVKLLLDEGAEINFWSEQQDVRCSSWTPLTVAAGEGHVEVCQFLLDHGALVDLPHPHRASITPLLVASGNGKFEAVKLLLKYGAEVNLQLIDDSTALYQGCVEGHLDVVKVLVAHGASINIPFKNGVTALMAASQTGQLEVVKFLLQKRAQVNTQSKSGWTALMCATSANHHEIVAELLAHGADTDIATTKSGLTPLIIATKNNFPEIVELLLNAKAQVNNREKISRQVVQTDVLQTLQ